MRALPRRAAVLGVLAFSLVLHAACARKVGAEARDIAVAVVEPRASQSGSGELGYSVSFGDSKLTTTFDVLRGFDRTHRERLAILIHQDVPIGTLGTLVSMASKSGYAGDSIAVFIFYKERTTMLEIPGYRNVRFSTDPKEVSGFLR